jgi:death-on-curing family protein
VARKRARRVVDLAAEAGLDLDEAIVTLWDAGIDEVEDGTDFVSGRLLTPARRALGLDDGREQLRVDYWLRLSGLHRDELASRLQDAGIRLSPASRRVPKGSLRRLRRMFNPAQALEPETKPAEGPLDPLQWLPVGRGSPDRFLTADEVRAIHETLEADFMASSDPIWPPGIRDTVMLESAVTRPRTSLGETAKYVTVEMAGAATFHSLVHNHAFHNGNKRTALVGLAAFLDENGLVLTCNQKELFRFTLRTSQHRLVPEHADQLADREVQVIARWIASNSRQIERGERPMKWGRLKQRLRDFGCSFEPAPGVGHRLNITRTVREPRPLRRVKEFELHTQVAWSGDGSDADRSTVHKIRRDLHLDDAHDCDSGAFYFGYEIDSFIIDYRRILQRLAKL